MCTAMQGTPGGRRTRENALTLSDVCGMQKPLKTPFRGIVDGLIIMQARPEWRRHIHGARERAQTGREGAGRTSGRARSSAGRWAAPGAIWGGCRDQA